MRLYWFRIQAARGAVIGRVSSADASSCATSLWTLGVSHPYSGRSHRMRSLFAVIGIVFVPLLLVAQAVQPEYSKVEAFAGYTYLRNSGHGFNGWEGQFTYNFNRYLGATADVSGHYRTAAGFSPLSGFSLSANQRLY